MYWASFWFLIPLSEINGPKWEDNFLWVIIELSKEILTIPVMEYIDKDHVIKLANKIKSFLTKFSKIKI